MERKQSPEAPSEAALALEAILSGGSWDRLPENGMLALSHRMGNGALLEVLANRGGGPERETAALPPGPCLTQPVEWGAGAPVLSDAPDFASFSPLGPAAPAEV